MRNASGHPSSSLLKVRKHQFHVSYTFLMSEGSAALILTARPGTRRASATRALRTETVVDLAHDPLGQALDANGHLRGVHDLSPRSISRHLTQTAVIACGLPATDEHSLRAAKS